VIEPTHPSSNRISDMSVAFIDNYSFTGRRYPIDTEALLVTDFVNLKISRSSLLEVLVGVVCTCMCS
jgi:hypothetical protein